MTSRGVLETYVHRATSRGVLEIDVHSTFSGELGRCLDFCLVFAMNMHLSDERVLFLGLAHDQIYCSDQKHILHALYYECHRDEVSSVLFGVLFDRHARPLFGTRAFRSSISAP